MQGVLGKVFLFNTDISKVRVQYLSTHDHPLQLGKSDILGNAVICFLFSLNNLNVYYWKYFYELNTLAYWKNSFSLFYIRNFLLYIISYT